MILLFLSMLTIEAVAYVAGYYITRQQLTDIHPLFWFKPFYCHPCCTTHIGWILQVSVGCLLEDWWYIGFGFAIAVGLGYLMKKSEEEMAEDDEPVEIPQEVVDAIIEQNEQHKCSGEIGFHTIEMPKTQTPECL